MTYLCSDVTRLPLAVVACQHGAALGSSIHAAVAAHVYSGVAQAADRMGSTLREIYQPNEARALEYDLLFTEYDPPSCPPSLECSKRLFHHHNSRESRRFVTLPPQVPNAARLLRQAGEHDAPAEGRPAQRGCLMSRDVSAAVISAFFKLAGGQAGCCSGDLDIVLRGDLRKLLVACAASRRTVVRGVMS